MLLQENTEPVTHTTFTVNANTAYTTVKSVDLISNGGSITASADKEITKPAEELQNHHHPLLLPLTISYPPVVTLTQLLVVMIVVV